jgi:hypothetical protein
MKEADFVVLDGDPTADITAVEKTKTIVFKREVVTGVGQ